MLLLNSVYQWERKLTSLNNFSARLAVVLVQVINYTYVHLNLKIVKILLHGN